jgi:ABC-type Fe3+ transport system substrate-binding protein
LEDVDWKEGAQVTSGGGSMSFIKGAPNPNAAKVFVNWFLSRKGQTALQKYVDLYGEEPPNSRRNDISKDMLPPLSRLIPGKKYFDVSDPKYADLEPIFQLSKEIMKAREQK